MQDDAASCCHYVAATVLRLPDQQLQICTAEKYIKNML